MISRCPPKMFWLKFATVYQGFAVYADILSNIHVMTDTDYRNIYLLPLLPASAPSLPPGQSIRNCDNLEYYFTLMILSLLQIYKKNCKP